MRKLALGIWMVAGNVLANGIGNERAAGLLFSCDSWGGLRVETLSRNQNWDGTFNQSHYNKIAFNSREKCLETVRPLQQKFAVVMGFKVAQFAICDRFATLYVLMATDSAVLNKVRNNSTYTTAAFCSQAAAEFNTAQPEYP